jgi:hypothetical protein
VYVFPPVAPLSMDATDRLTATCTMIMCVGIISHIHESSRQATVDRLRDFNEKLRRSTEAKTLFLSAITHGIHDTHDTHDTQGFAAFHIQVTHIPHIPKRQSCAHR